MMTAAGDTMRVFVLEDEASIVEICRRVLTAEGFEVGIAINGKGALKMIREKNYDVYLFDIRTPEMNGIELYQWLSENYPQLTEKVIFTTGSITAGETLNFIKQTNRPLLPKPFSPEELINIVKEAVKRV